MFKWTPKTIQTASIIWIVILSVLAVGSICLYTIPGYMDCRAAGHDRLTCYASIEYWAHKRLWGF